MPVVTDLETAMRPESPLARVTTIVPAQSSDDAGAVEPKSAHAAVGGAGLHRDLADAGDRAQ